MVSVAIGVFMVAVLMLCALCYRSPYAVRRSPFVLVFVLDFVFVFHFHRHFHSEFDSALPYFACFFAHAFSNMCFRDSKHLQVNDGRSLDNLPSAATCFQSMRMPRYPTKAILRQKLLLSVREGNTGFAFS